MGEKSGRGRMREPNKREPKGRSQLVFVQSDIYLSPQFHRLPHRHASLYLIWEAESGSQPTTGH